MLIDEYILYPITSLNREKHEPIAERREVIYSNLSKDTKKKLKLRNFKHLSIIEDNNIIYILIRCMQFDIDEIAKTINKYKAELREKRINKIL